MRESLLFRANSHVPQPALGVLQRAPKQAEQIFLIQGTQLEDLRARNKRRVDEKKRVVRRGADQTDRAPFNVWKQHILLCFVEAMDFVDKENRWFASVGQAVGGGRENTAHVGHVGFDAAQTLEAIARLSR